MLITSTGTANWNTNGAWIGGVQPTAADDVIIASAITIPTATTVLARSITVNAGASLAGASTSALLQLGDGTAGAGNSIINISATATITNTGIWTIQLLSTSATQQTITTNGKTLPNVTAAASGASYLLAGALTCSGTLSLNGSTFDTGNFAMTLGSFSQSGSTTRVITLGSSAITINGAGTVITSTSTTGLTMTANTAVITITSASSSPNMTINWNGASLVITGSTITLSNGGGTWNNVTRTGTANKTDAMNITSGATLTCTGTFTANGNSITNRLLITSATTGAPATINAATVSVTNADFKDITGAGAGSWNLSAISGGSGDCGGNSGITFTTAAAQTYDTTAGNWSTAARWTSRVPLPQDDVSFSTSSVAVAMDMPRVGKNVNFTNYSGTLSWTTSLGQTFFGSVTFTSGMTFSFGNTVNWSLAGRGTHTFTSAGKTFTGTNMSPTVDAFGGSYTLQDAYSSAHSFTLNCGTLDTNGFSFTVSTFASATVLTRTLSLGTSTVNLTSTAVATLWNMSVTTNLTLNAASSTIIIPNASASTRTFSGGNQRFGTLTYNVAASTGQLTLAGNNTFNTVNIGTARTLALTIGTVTTINTLFNASGTAGNLVTLVSTTAGTLASLRLFGAPPTLDYMSIKDIRSDIPYKFYAGANSTDVSGNTNIIFTAKVTQPYIVDSVCSLNSATGTSLTTNYPNATTAGNLLVVIWKTSSDPSTITAPAGYTLAVSRVQGTATYIYMWYKIADGTETSATTSWVTSRIANQQLLEIGGWSGTPTLDVTDSNSQAGSATSFSTGTGVTPSLVPAYAIAALGGNGFVGLTTANPTNSYQEDWTTSSGSSGDIKVAGEPQVSATSQTTTFSWTTGRVPASLLAIFKDAPVSSYQKQAFMQFMPLPF